VSTCRFCGNGLHTTFVDLGMSPLSNAFLTAAQCQQGETFYPLHAYVCAQCLLVQLEEFAAPTEIFRDYAYFSSYSHSWLEHCQRYVESMLGRFRFNQVIELASNDGYLLQYFQALARPVLGIEPAANVAQVALDKGIPTLVRFFGAALAEELVKQGTRADLLIGNNVLAHVPDLNDFVAGMKILLQPQGIITMEFPHLLQLMRENQFDTIYHEHFSYFSLIAVEQIFAAHDLVIFDVETLPTHGGSLRIYATHYGAPISAQVQDLRSQEQAFGLGEIRTYQGFSEQVKATKRKLLAFLIEAKTQGKTLVGYGAAAKGNTLLNYAGIRQDFIDYVVDRNPHKQHRFLPGTHLPIYPPEKIIETKPDYVIILPWNIKEEVIAQLDPIRDWGGKFVIFIPEVQIL